MFAEIEGFDRAALSHLLADRWGVTVPALDYVPVGFGTHHYVGGDAGGVRWFANVWDAEQPSMIAGDAIDILRRALGSAVHLHQAGLGFVLAPRPTTGGEVVAALGDRFVVALFPFVDGSSNPDGEYASDDERRLVLEALGRLHAATDLVPAGLPRRDGLDVPARDRLFDAFDDLGRPWKTGPYGERARTLLTEREQHLRDAFARYDALVDAVRNSGRAWVLTHGEPHGANVLRGRDGSFHLIDWDTAAIAPPERDLWQTGATDWDVYVAAGGTGPPDPDAIALYALWWDLCEVALYTETFRSPHVDDANTQESWKWMEHFATR